MKLLLAFAIMWSSLFALPPKNQTNFMPGDKLQIEIFISEWEEHRYVLFFSHWKPEISTWLHDASCPQCEKERGINGR